MSIPVSTAFVGIDASKDDLVLAIDGQSKIIAFPNNTCGRTDFIAYLTDLRRQLRVALEATGGYEWPVWQALEGQGIPVRQVSPAEVRAFAASLGQKSKTDPIDARAIAAFLAFRPEAGRQLPAEDVRYLRGLATARRQRVDMLTTLKAQTARTSEAAVKVADEALIRHIESQTEDLETQIAQALEGERFREKARLLRSIKGIGPVATVTLLAGMPELGTLSAKQIAALTGLAPRARDSGQRQGVRFIQGGRKLVRDVLNMTATVAARFNPDLKAFFERLRDKGMPWKKAIIAVARKPIVLANAVLKRGKPGKAIAP